MFKDVDVLETASIDADEARRYPKPWLAVEQNGDIHQFDTEDEACAFQRGYRVANGLNPLSGDPVKIHDIEWMSDRAVTVIANLRQNIIEPVDLKVTGTISIELFPASYDDRIYVYRREWGGTVVNYTSEGLFIDVFDGDECNLDPVHSIAIVGSDLEVETESSPDIDLDMVAEWVGQHYKINFDTLSLDLKEEWKSRYQEAHKIE